MKNTNESGRSMVEMLGVLAIIGVLSIGGIAGYTLAMNRYRANEILNAAALVSIAATSANGGVGDTANLANLGGVGTMTLPAINNDGAITGYANGEVDIQIETGYEAVMNVINSLVGNRVVTNATGGHTNTAITINMGKSVKNQ